MGVVGSIARAGLGLGALGGLAAVGVRRAADGIRANPDPWPYEVLRRDPEGETVWIDRPDGTRVRCVVAGEGPTVVLAHGFAVSLVEWNVVMPALVARGHRVVAFDWRGHGRTTIGTDGVSPEAIAGDHAAVLEHFDVRDGVFVGHSTGGYLAIAMLLTHADAAARLRGLVLFASFAGDVLVEAPQNRAQIPMIEAGVMDRIVRHDDLGTLFAASVWGHGASPAACRVFCEEFAARDMQALLPLLDRLSRTSYYDRLHELEVPTIVVCGEEDRTTPRWHSETMGRDIPGARNVWVPDAGHMLNWQAPETLVAAVEELHADRRPTLAEVAT